MATTVKAKDEFKFEVLADLGTIGTPTQYTAMHVRVGVLNEETAPRVDVRQYKQTRFYTGWARGASLTLEQYEDLKQRIPQIDAAIAARSRVAA
jgi:hypothetical protein